MPAPRFTNDVDDALETLRSFIDQQKSGKRRARKPIWSDSEYAAQDRVKYYDNNLTALRQVVTGHTIDLAEGNYQEGLDL